MRKSNLLFLLISFLIFSGCSKDDDVSLSFEEQLALDVDIIKAYLKGNNISAQKDESGVRYKHLIEGEGEIPEVGDVVAIKVKGTLLDGTIFTQDTIGFTITLKDPIIEALQIGVPLMREGGRIILYAPSVYCFGSQESGSIPANSNLIIEIELISIINNADEQLIVDEAIIDEFLEERDIEAEIHSSGIRFVTETEGSGESPTVNDKVFVKYKGTLLTGATFDSNNIGVEFSLQNLIEAWKIMIPTMKDGGKMTIYSPSKYCYGTSGTQTIAPNTILVFEIELVDIR